MSQTEGGRLFRESWIAGVRRHFPGEPKAGYVADWDALPEWQQASDADIFEAIEAVRPLVA
ncbi:hypothetical protein [Streptomyces drozdowiczii]|uniref:Uncharacterized protein n=1 Tax=Streptomyces drozdowiczii TaxID=202862 RepID=A0ABY6Q2S2_9ACTN|nr:hypothetical protein [Streptomyces drozdowiczii]MCX0243535.1 hypothetical protein [Streptomyces drozdowiczii]UZK58737.1 hypothetical protein NEH16_22910 [Streptomyces drozdowiczii]